MNTSPKKLNKNQYQLQNMKPLTGHIYREARNFTFTGRYFVEKLFSVITKNFL